jgi:hypothetical protein
VVPKLTITIRHSDWNYWEIGHALRIEEPDNTKWGGWIGSVPGLQELELELETLEAKKDELEERVQVARRWTFPLANGACLVHDGAPPVQSVWLATAALAPPGVRHVLAGNHRRIFNPAVEENYDANYPLDLKLHVKRLAFKLESVVVNK